MTARAEPVPAVRPPRTAEERARRVVVVTVEPPLPFGNAAARWYYVLLKGLTARGYDVTALATCAHPEDAAAARDLFPLPTYDLRCYLPDQDRGLRGRVQSVLRPHSYLYSAALRRDLRRALSAPYDVLHLEQQWSGWLGLTHVERALVNVQYLFGIDLADVPERGLAQRAARARTIAAEATVLRRYRTISTVSPRLTEEVRKLNPTASVHTVPLGIDVTLYPYREILRAAGRPTVGLIGSFTWQPTLDAARRLVTALWPAVKQRVPDARLLLVGRGAKAAVDQIDPTLDATVAEDVPDVLPYFRELDLMLYAPYRGSGTKVKVLESFALGVPVVTSTDGIEGIPAIDGVHAGISDDNAGLVRRAVVLLRDDAAADRQRRHARDLVERHLATDPALDALERVYAHVGAGATRHAMPRVRSTAQ